MAPESPDPGPGTHLGHVLDRVGRVLGPDPVRHARNPAPDRVPGLVRVRVVPDLVRDRVQGHDPARPCRAMRGRAVNAVWTPIRRVKVGRVSRRN